VFFLLSANSGFTQISISGPSNVCPQIDLGTNNYTYTVNNLPSGSSAYTISPNPATSSLTIDFEYKEFAEGLLESIELLDFDGNSYSKTNFKEEKNASYFKEKKSFTINTKNFKRGNYVLHLNYGGVTDKKQIILK
jgi:hypothetical protein